MKPILSIIISKMNIVDNVENIFYKLVKLIN
jgi:hypothetical protein